MKRTPIARINLDIATGVATSALDGIRAGNASIATPQLAGSDFARQNTSANIMPSVMVNVDLNGGHHIGKENSTLLLGSAGNVCTAEMQTRGFLISIILTHLSRISRRIGIIRHQFVSCCGKARLGIFNFFAQIAIGSRLTLKHGRRRNFSAQQHDIARRRIQAALDAPDMFIEQPKPSKQEVLL